MRVAVVRGPHGLHGGAGGLAPIRPTSSRRARHTHNKVEHEEHSAVSRTCTVCRHADRTAIDQALVAGEPVRAVASRYVTLGYMAIQRHKDEHLPATLRKAHAAEEVARADDLLAQ